MLYYVLITNNACKTSIKFTLYWKRLKPNILASYWNKCLENIFYGWWSLEVVGNYCSKYSLQHIIEVNLIPIELFHIIITINLHFTCIHSLFLSWFSTHLTLAFIKTPNSWLFHITKIYTSKYLVKNSWNNIIIHFIIFWYYRKFTQQYEHRNIVEV